jgi:hypothetical protein
MVLQSKHHLWGSSDKFHRHSSSWKSVLKVPSLDAVTTWNVFSGEIDSISASSEISSCLWKLKFYYNVCRWTVIPSQLNPVHSLTFYFPMIHSGLILPSSLMSSKWFLPFRTFTQILHLSYFPRFLRTPPVPFFFFFLLYKYRQYSCLLSLPSRTYFPKFYLII